MLSLRSALFALGLGAAALASHAQQITIRFPVSGGRNDAS